MTPNERAAFNEGIRVAQQFALIAAITLETRGDAGELRQQTAVAALQGLAAGLKDTFLSAGSPPVVEVTTCFEPELNRLDETDAW